MTGTRSARSSARLSGSDALTLFAVGLVVVIVSLPRIRTLALHENEHDALQTVRLLSGAVFASDRAPDLGEVLAKDAALKRRLEDVEVLEEGRVLRRHGYLFDVTRTAGGARVLRAWPWSFGETGYGAFVLTDSHRLVGHPNAPALWSGIGSPPDALDEPTLGADSRWRVLDEPDRLADARQDVP